LITQLLQTLVSNQGGHKSAATDNYDGKSRFPLLVRLFPLIANATNASNGQPTNAHFGRYFNDKMVKTFPEHRTDDAKAISMAGFKVTGMGASAGFVLTQTVAKAFLFKTDAPTRALTPSEVNMGLKKYMFVMANSDAQDPLYQWFCSCCEDIEEWATTTPTLNAEAHALGVKRLINLIEAYINDPTVNTFNDVANLHGNRPFGAGGGAHRTSMDTTFNELRMTKLQEQMSASSAAARPTRTAPPSQPRQPVVPPSSRPRPTDGEFEFCRIQANHLVYGKPACVNPRCSRLASHARLSVTGLTTLRDMTDAANTRAAKRARTSGR
jgi:hypothetical protein